MGNYADPYTERYVAEHPQQIRAYIAVRQALRLGTLTREPCLFCDQPRAEAHHHDYSQPLDVTWLCRRHHRLVHRSRPQ